MMLSGSIPIREMGVTGIVLISFLAYLYIERLRLGRHVENIPLRICVTGTRGKSGVTRLIASILRDSGYRVLAKTTGSRAVVIGLDGREEEISRSGIPSPLESKKLLKKAAGLKAQAVVMEMMGIRPESLHVESTGLIRPHILVITNVRLDHLADMGATREAIAACFASSIPEKGTVFVPQTEFFPVFQTVAEKRYAGVKQVDNRDLLAGEVGDWIDHLSLEFEDNIGLALALSRHLGIDRDKALKAVTQTAPDFGALKVWVTDAAFPHHPWFFVSAFAANDPESTRNVISKLQAKMLLKGRRLIGLLNFRSDRADRTLQWLKALQKNEFPEFERIVLLGDHTRAVMRRLNSVQRIKFQAWPKLSPETIMKRLLEMENGEAVLIGLGNMGGAGKAIVDYWEQTGRRHDL